jgi:hypothetical protein
MAKLILARLYSLCMAGALLFGTIAAFEQTSDAQITVKCWKEVCVTNPTTGEEGCIREQIPCPSET